MLTFIYRHQKRSDVYLFLTKKDDFSVLSMDLQDFFKKAIFVMVVNLNKHKTLSMINSDELKNILQEKGFYLYLVDEKTKKLLNS